MRFASYSASGRNSYGIVTADGIVDLGKRFGNEYPTLKSLIEAGFPKKVDAAASEDADFAVDEVEFRVPVPDAIDVWCLALNYVEHLDEVVAAGRQQNLPAQPALFMRSTTSLVGHGQDLHHPGVSEQYDYEGELGVIIGKAGRNVSEEDALDYVAGYTIINEGSIRDWQFHTKQITPGKNWYRSGAAGPWMVRADQISDPHKLSIKTTLNGQVVQNGTSADMVHKINKFISYLSTITVLKPGDILSTGTPSGVGFSRKPPLWMKVGDVCTVEISEIGTLSNKIVAAS